MMEGLDDLIEMAQGNAGDITVLLRRLQGGDRDAESRLITAVYNELHRMASRYMRRERAGHTLQTTALVNEAYLKLVNQKEANWQNRSHFFALAAQVMRRILVDYARNRLAEKRGGGVEALPLEEGLVFTQDRCTELLALDAALEKLESQDKRVSKVVELRFFSGLSVDETAAVLKISTRTVKRDWNFGRAWLRAELESAGGDGSQSAGVS